MNQLKSSLRKSRARRAKFSGALGIVAAALVAVALTVVSPTPPHAEAQSPPEPPDSGQFWVLRGVGFDDRTNAARGQHLTITYTPSSPDCWIERPSVRLEIYRSWAGTSQASDDFALVETDGSTPCNYEINSPKNEDGPWARWERWHWVGTKPNLRKETYTGSDSTPFTSSECGDNECELTVSYRRAAISRFEPQIAISVPDAPSDAFVGTRFAVNIERVGSDANCTAMETVNYVVQAGSTTAVADGDLPLLVYDPDTTAAGPTCSYTATFPEPFDVTHADSTTTTLENGGDQTAMFNNPTPVARSYQAQPEGYAPALFVRVPYVDPNIGTSALAGATLNVTYTALNMAEQDRGCTPTATETLTVSGGDPSNGGIALPPDPRVVALTDVPTGEQDRCRYVANFADSVTGEHSGTQYGPYAIYSGDNTEFTSLDVLTVVYSNEDTLMFPSFDFQVPQTFDANDISDYADGVLTARVSVASGPAAGGCTTAGDGGAFTAEFTVRDDGTLGTTAPRPAMWVDVPESESTSCTYSVTIADEITSPTGVNPPWTLYRQGRPTKTVRASALAVADEFATTEPPEASTFEPAVAITVPPYNGDGAGSGENAFVDEQFVVRFARAAGAAGGPTEGCSDAASTETTYAVGADGTVTPMGGPPDLVNVPKFETTGCVYTVTFPTAERDDGTRLVRQAAGLDTQTQDSDRAATATYHATQTSFAPAPTFAGIPYVDDGAGANALARVPLRIDLAVKVTMPPQHDDCTDTTFVAYQVDDAGDAADGGAIDSDPATVTSASLVDRPAGVNDRCVYVASIGDLVHATHGTWAPVTNDVDVVAGQPWQITFHRAETTFTPEVSIVVPPYNGDGANSARNAFAGRTIEVSFERSGGPATDCSTGVTETYVVRDTGDVEPQDGSDPVLTHQPAGVDGGCVYAVTYQTPVGADPALNRIATGLDATTSDAAKSTSATYHAEQTTLVPSLTWQVPFIDGADAGTDNDFVGQTITVDYARVGDAHMSCTRVGQEIYTVGPGGSESAGGEVSGPTSAVTLVDRPAGVNDRCTYTVSVTDRITASGGEVASIADGSNNQENPGRWPLTVTYSLGTTFAPTVTITVPSYDRDGAAGTNWFAGASFAVTFTAKAGEGPPSGCETVTKNYVVAAGSNVAVPDGGLPSLVDVPRGRTGNCVYVAELPTMVPSAQGVVPAWVLRNTGTTTQDVSNADVVSRAVSRSYDADAINFAPSVAVTVPQIVGLTAGENLFDRAEFEVTLSRAASPTPHDECSLDTALTVPFTVDASGTATASTASPNALPTSLVDRPQGETTRCAYVVTFAPTVSSAADAELTWTLTPDVTAATLAAGTAASASATGAYGTSVAVTYAPDVAFALPSYLGDDDPETSGVDESTQHAFTGAQLRASFASAAVGCDDATLTFTVQTGGAVTPDDPSATLVAYPAGASADSDLCTYDVTFDDHEIGDTRLELRSGATPTVTGLMQSVAVSYDGARTTFAPAVTVAVPFVDADNDEVNDLAGQSVVVTYERADSPEQHAECSSDETETFVVGAGGSENAGGEVTPPAVRVLLVDRPAGEVDRCSYVANASDSITPTGGAAIGIAMDNDNQPVTADGGAITIGYGFAGVPPQTPGTQTPNPQTPGPQTPGSQQPTTSRQTGGVPSGGAARGTSGGGGGGGRSTGGSGGGSGAGSSGGSTGPWLVASSSRVPVSVSLAMPAEASFPVGAAVEVWLSVPGTCGDDTTAFSGLAAEVGLVYALAARPGESVDVLAAGALRLAGYAQRGDQTRGCELRVTLVSAPPGCTFEGASTDDAGRSYVELSGGESVTTYAATPRLTCA